MKKFNEMSDSEKIELIAESLSATQTQTLMMNNTFQTLQGVVVDAINAMVEISPSGTKDFLATLVTNERNEALELHNKQISEQCAEFKSEYTKVLTGESCQAE